MNLVPTPAQTESCTRDHPNADGGGEGEGNDERGAGSWELGIPGRVATGEENVICWSDVAISGFDHDLNRARLTGIVLEFEGNARR